MIMPDLLNVTQQFPYAGLFILLFLGGMGLPVPEELTLITCGFLLFQGIIEPAPAFIVVYSGLLVADVLVYWFGKANGEKITRHRWFQKFISPRRLSRLEANFKRRGVLYILLGRHILGFRVQLFLAAGVMNMPLPKFIAADGLSAVVTMAVMTGIGYLGGGSIEALRRDVARIEHVLTLALIGAVVLFFMAQAVFRGKARWKSG